MLNQKIHEVVNSRDLFELADALESFIAYIDNITNKEKAFNNLYQKVHQRKILTNLFDGQTICTIVDEFESVLMYLYNYWLFQKTYEENIYVLSGIIKNIRENILLPQKSTISDDVIIDLLKYADYKFAFSRDVLKNNPLQILRLNHTHKNWNSYYSATIFEDGRINDCIILTHLSNNSIFKQEFSFFHELGHLLHTRITKKLSIVPESFEMVFHKNKGISEDEKIEHFADFFAIAVLYNSPFAKYDPYITMEKESKIFMQDYFNWLIQRFNKNI